MRKPVFSASILLVAAILAAPSFADNENYNDREDRDDQIVLKFSTVGDSRQDAVAPDSSVINKAQIGVGKCSVPTGSGLVPNPGLSGQDCKWLQNTAAWSRIMRTIQSQKANLLFFNGDMIMGYGKAGVPVTRTAKGTAEKAITSPAVSDILTSDLMQIYQQYGFWRGMVANLMETGTYVVPVPGNHEVQCKRCNKAAQVENETAWKDNMGDLILDQIRLNNLLTPKGLTLNPSTWDVTNAPGAADSLTTDQSQLSYSFDIGTSHFAVINTDPVGKDGHAPTIWLDADLTSAVKSGAQHLFVFGHKPAFFYSYSGAAPSSTSSLQLADPGAADAFWTVIANHQATYFSGHEHIYDVESFISNAAKKSALQVIVGAGGSPFESSTPTSKTTDRMYSWATVSIYKSGKVVMNTYGFDDTLTNPVTKLDSRILPAAQ